MPLLFAYGINRFSRDIAQFKIVFKSSFHLLKTLCFFNLFIISVNTDWKKTVEINDFNMYSCTLIQRERDHNLQSNRNADLIGRYFCGFVDCL